MSAQEASHVDISAMLASQRSRLHDGSCHNEGARIGVIILATDEGTEAEIKRLLPPEVRVFVNRVRSYLECDASETARLVAGRVVPSGGQTSKSPDVIDDDTS
jgi:hypothetical protein